MPATFQLVVDYTIRPFLDKFAVYYLDDILIFSKILLEYTAYVKVVLDVLYMQKLLVNKDKSKFYVMEIVFLSYEISLGQIRMELTKVEAIKNWPILSRADYIGRLSGCRQGTGRNASQSFRTELRTNQEGINKRLR